LLSAIAAACGSGTTSTGTGGSDGGNPGNCPAARPAAGDACSSSGLECQYGCNVFASCDGQHWNVSMLNIACAVDSGAGGDGSTNCHSNADCKVGYECSPGGATVGCGICVAPQYPCSIDSDCAVIGDAAPAQPMVCGPGGGCTCPVGGKSGNCIPACKGPSDCGADEACASSGHCVVKPCTSDADCPSASNVDYACSAAGTCGVKPCKTDADCGAHYCVNSTCYPQPGMCTPPAA
jgi:hypothetical protein